MLNFSEALRIEGEMTVYRAAELKQLLQPLFEGGRASPSIDAIELSGVTEMDCSGVQLLLLARRAAAAAGRTLPLQHASAPVVEVFALLGLDPSSAT